MCRGMDIYYDGEAEGARRNQAKDAMNMINNNVSAEKVAEYSELSLSEVHQLEERKKRREALQPA